MSLYKQWQDLIENQTDATFPRFWEDYSKAEATLYSAVLSAPGERMHGTVGELIEKHQVDPVLFMGFLDGVQGSLQEEFDLKKADESTEIELDIDFEKLFFNMLAADAEHLFSLSEWDNVFSMEKRQEIADTWRRSRTVVKEKEPGRNDPCPCGSGKKYKKCCGANQ